MWENTCKSHLHYPTEGGGCLWKSVYLIFQSCINLEPKAGFN